MTEWCACNTIIIISNSLTVRVVGAPQMIFTTSFLSFSLFSTALWDLPNSRPVHSLMLSSHLVLCLPCFLPPFTVPCKMVLARPDKWETWPYHSCLGPFTIVRKLNAASGLNGLTFKCNFYWASVPHWFFFSFFFSLTFIVLCGFKPFFFLSVF